MAGVYSMTLPLMALGGRGVISVVSNIIPDRVAKMSELLLKNKIENARKIHYEILHLTKMMFIETNPGPIKCAMNMLGRPAGKLRLPLVSPLAQSEERIKTALKDIGLM